MAVLQGFDVDISDIGGWSLDVHHHYNFHEGKIYYLLSFNKCIISMDLYRLTLK